MTIDPTRTGRVVLAGSEKPLDPRTTLLQAVDPHERIDVTVRLRPDQAIPDAYAGEARDRFEQQHGARQDDIAKVTAFAHDYGLEVGGISRAQRTIGLSGTAGQMHAAFGVDLAQYRTPEETYRGRVGVITLPAAVADAVGGVFGLDDRSTSKSHLVPAAAANSARGFTPLDVAQAYRFPAGDGSGEHVAVISLGGHYDDAAQAAYCKRLGVPHVPFHVVNIDGGADNPADAGPTGENTLDAQIIGSVVPNADKTMYIAPNTDRGFLDAISTALHDDHHNTAMSISWGGPEERFTPQALRAFNELFKEARAMGVNVFCAAGDNGSADGVNDGNDHVDFPASSPGVIANGGTKLVTGAGGDIAKETVWNELRWGEGATGGGISALNPKPPIQRAIDISGRGVPDIAGDADPTTGFQILVPAGPHGKSALQLIGGTSAVAPLYAALAARLEQNLGRPLGDLQRAIYSAPPSDFNDITSGNNGSFKAAPGWDAVTGRGSVDGAALLAYLRAHPQSVT
ncbi:MAG: S53 family peptidase [Candidatus Velthaea sp.]